MESKHSWFALSALPTGHIIPYIDGQGCTEEQVRKHIAPPNHLEAPLITTLRYFTSLLSEVPGLPVSDGYWVPPDSKVTAPSIRE